MEDTTNLATVVKVMNLLPIMGRDKIELAVIHGWKCVVKKGDFKVGDLGIYLAIGCVPDFTDPNFSFLQPKYNRIKTIKMCGVVSQGLLGPLHWLASRGSELNAETLSEGDNVSKEMGVLKYIPPEEEALYSHKQGNLPFPIDVVPKTDATRLQHHPHEFLEAITGKPIVVTRKEDGCSCTYIVQDGEFSVCGRNFIFPESATGCEHYFEMETKFSLREKMVSLGRNIAVQGEIVGPKINGNRLQLTERTFVVFDIFDLDRQCYLLYKDLFELCTLLEVNTVPLLYQGPSADFQLTVEGLLGFADGVEYLPGVGAEGIVVKLNDKNEPETRLTFKVISNKYLLKHDL